MTSMNVNFKEEIILLQETTVFKFYVKVLGMNIGIDTNKKSITVYEHVHGGSNIWYTINDTYKAYRYKRVCNTKAPITNAILRNYTPKSFAQALYYLIRSVIQFRAKEETDVLKHRGVLNKMFTKNGKYKLCSDTYYNMYYTLSKQDVDVPHFSSLSPYEHDVFCNTKTAILNITDEEVEANEKLRKLSPNIVMVNVEQSDNGDLSYNKVDDFNFSAPNVQKSTDDIMQDDIRRVSRNDNVYVEENHVLRFNNLSKSTNEVTIDNMNINIKFKDVTPKKRYTGTVRISDNEVVTYSDTNKESLKRKILSELAKITVEITEESDDCE